jgi:Sigma-70, region 4
MSAALQVSLEPEPEELPNEWPEAEEFGPEQAGVHGALIEGEESAPSISLAFYRKHTERMLRRYLYASMQVGRAPSILSNPVSRGWVSSRPVKTFEDAVIFVLDVEKCLNRLSALDRAMLSRIVLQEYTQAEAAALLGMSARAVSYKFPLALDRLTEQLMEYELLTVAD